MVLSELVVFSQVTRRLHQNDLSFFYFLILIILLVYNIDLQWNLYLIKKSVVTNLTEIKQKLW